MDGQKLFSCGVRHERLHKPLLHPAGKEQEEIGGVSAGKNKNNGRLINIPYGGELQIFNPFSLSLGRLRSDSRVVSKCLHRERSNKNFNLADEGTLRSSGWKPKAFLQRNKIVLGAEQLR